MVAEAWISHDLAYGQGDKAPSMDPKREDAAICVAYFGEDRRISVAPVFEKGNRKRLGDFKDMGPDFQKFEMWTDRGFQPIKAIPLDAMLSAQGLFDMILELFTQQKMVTNN